MSPQGSFKRLPIQMHWWKGACPASHRALGPGVLRSGLGPWGPEFDRRTEGSLRLVAGQPARSLLSSCNWAQKLLRGEVPMVLLEHLGELGVSILQVPGLFRASL